MQRRRCLNGISPYRARSAAATGGSAPGSIACARASLACSIANSIAGAEAADRLRLLWRELRSRERRKQLGAAHEREQERRQRAHLRVVGARSEERRVGKEWRCGWSPQRHEEEEQ